ncbi:alpha/beta hydrolase family protein [Streptomyces sp. NPDC059255]|uniref:alpha/beta hydrolase family protein n=1 Tax=Streptomyces sp. NPDC059255 TaxID=3346793 RepID=UPI0036AD7291
MLARSPITMVDRIRTPLLLAQGANDARVHRAIERHFTKHLAKRPGDSDGHENGETREDEKVHNGHDDLSRSSSPSPSRSSSPSLSPLPAPGSRLTDNYPRLDKFFCRVDSECLAEMNRTPESEEPACVR